MLIIGKFRLHLPAQMRQRAGPIVRLIAQEMALASHTSDITLDTVRPPVVQVRSSFSNQQIAREIANKIQTQIQSSSVNHAENN